MQKLPVYRKNFPSLNRRLAIVQATPYDVNGLYGVHEMTFPFSIRDLLQIGASLTQRARYTIPGMGPCRNSPVGQTGL